jgi:hypothetical protein
MKIILLAYHKHMYDENILTEITQSMRMTAVLRRNYVYFSSNAQSIFSGYHRL